MKQVLWWICLLAAPLVLITIELFHPANFTASPGMYEFLSHAEHYNPTYQALGYFGPEWWFALHMIQTPMVGLVAVGLWLMVDDVGAADGSAAMVCAWLARAAIFVFAVYFTVLDAIGGIGLGRTIVVVERRQATRRHQDAAQQDVDRSPGRRRRIIRQPDGILGSVRRVGPGRRDPSAVEPGRLGEHGGAGRLWLGTADQSCRPAWPERVRPAHRRVRLAVVDPTAARSSCQNRLKFLSPCR
jgi:hypothetical protein